MKKVLIMMLVAVLLSCGGGSRGGNDCNQTAMDYMVAVFKYDFETQRQLGGDKILEELDYVQEIRATHGIELDGSDVKILDVSVKEGDHIPNAVYVNIKYQDKEGTFFSNTRVVMEQGEDGKWYVASTN